MLIFIVIIAQWENLVMQYKEVPIMPCKLSLHRPEKQKATVVRRLHVAATRSVSD